MSLPRYPEYKDSRVTWLGEVPTHWSVLRLKNLATIQNGSDYKHIQVDSEGYPVIGSGGEFARASEYLYDGESVLLGRKGTIDRPLYINGAFWPVDTMFYTTIKQETCAKYLYYCALTIKFDLYSTSTALPSMTQADLSNIHFAVPKFEEQTSIVTFLDCETAKIDGLIAEQKKLVSLLAEKRQATISHSVTKGLNPDAPMKDSGVAWLGTVPAHWGVTPLAIRYSVQLGKMLDSTKITGEHLRPYLRVFDVQWGSINTDELPMMDFDKDARTKFRLIPGDILVNEGGSYPGRSAIWTGEIDECYYQKALHRIRPLCREQDTTNFLYYVLSWAANQGVFIAGGNENTIEHLPAEKLRRYRFAFPPIAEQKSIATFLDAETHRLDTLSAEATRGIALLKERRSALISAVVTGKIDVRQS